MYGRLSINVTLIHKPQGNVLIDGAGNPRLTDFGLATVVGDAESQLSATTANHSFNPQWRAPEVIGIDQEVEVVQPNFESDVYSFGGVMFFIVSGDIPWKEKKQIHIIIELSKRATPARPDNILDDHWNLIQKCWSWNPYDRPEATEVVGYLAVTITSILGRAEMPERSAVFRCRLFPIF
ncbi:kinase-like domain-containing protein [Suillus subluteus]|nr:kinase-like domain-containing protein [Suillus subluteus]